MARSYEVLDRHAPHATRGYRTEQEFRYLVGTGASAAAIWLMRQALDEAGFDRVKIVASSGFGPAKCRMMAVADAPIDVIRHRLLSAGAVERDLRHRRHRRL